MIITREIIDMTLEANKFKNAPKTQKTLQKRLNAMMDLELDSLKEIFFENATSSSSTRNGYLWAYNAARTVMGESILIVKQPREVKISKNRALTHEEQQKILNLTGYGLETAICVLLMRTGMRAEEFVDAFNNGLLHPSRYEKFVITGKGSKDRWIFIDSNQKSNDFFIRALNHFLSGTKLNTKAVDRAVKTVMVAADIKNITASRITYPTPHCFRYTYAKNQYMAGVDLIKLKDLLGHADLETTSRYIQNSTEELEEASKYQYNHENLPSDAPTLKAALIALMKENRHLEEKIKKMEEN